MIDSSEITVVIKGLIVGKPTDNYKDKYTLRSIESIRKYLPRSKIILSTWEDCNVSSLDYDEVIKSQQPAKIFMLQEDGSLKLMTVNNQIITSREGLERVTTKYTLLIRSDIVLEGLGFLKYFSGFNKNESSGFLEKKIVVLPTYSPRRVVKFLFDVCDWAYFGLTEDLKKIFSIPLMEEINLKGEKEKNYYFISKNLEAEQYIWINFLKKYTNIDLPFLNYFTDELNQESESSYVKNTIMLPAKKFGVVCLKMPRAGYGAVPCLSQGLYTFSEYKKIYNIYNKDKIFYIHNYFEEFIYFIQLKSRNFLRKINPNLHKKVINLIRRLYGSKNFLK